MSLIPDTITPRELAEKTGWSERFVRETARAPRWPASGSATSAQDWRAKVITTEKPHRRHTEYSGIAFWNGDSASNEDEATRAVVYTGAPGMPYPEFEFKWPEQKIQVELLQTALHKAFECGKWVAKKEIREALGVVHRS